MSENKGQIFTPDFAASVVLFSIFLLSFGLIWNSAMSTFIQEGDLPEKQHDYTFSLLKTSGNPSDWNKSNVKMPGFYSDGYISAEKFLEFKEIGVRKQQQLLRIQNFYMELNELNGSTASYNGQNLTIFSGAAFSPKSIPTNSTIYTSRQVSVLKEKGKRVEFQFYTWPE